MCCHSHIDAGLIRWLCRLAKCILFQLYAMICPDDFNVLYSITSNLEDCLQSWTYCQIDLGKVLLAGFSIGWLLSGDIDMFEHTPWHLVQAAWQSIPFFLYSCCSTLILPNCVPHHLSEFVFSLIFYHVGLKDTFQLGELLSPMPNTPGLAP